MDGEMGRQTCNGLRATKSHGTELDVDVTSSWKGLRNLVYINIATLALAFMFLTRYVNDFHN